MSKGTSSLCHRSSRVLSTTGSAVWESTAVSPWPGKCFTTGITSPRSAMASTARKPKSLTHSQSLPKARSPITVLSGLDQMSKLGAKSMLKPKAAHSSASSTPYSAPAVPRAMACPTRQALGVRLTSGGIRSTRPPS